MPIRMQTGGRGGNAKCSLFYQFTGASLYVFWGWEGVNHGVRLSFLMDGAECECGGLPSPLVERCSGESGGLRRCSLTSVLLEAGLEVKKHGEKKTQLALCLHGDQAFSKRVNAGVLQRIPDAGERNRNRREVFPRSELTSHCLCFPGSCQTRNMQMSFSGGCRYLSRKPEFGSQLNYNVKPLQ